jgi:hypothetical protein
MTTFGKWMNQVEGELIAIAGCLSTRLPAYDYKADYLAGDDPATAAWAAFDASTPYSARDMLDALAVYSIGAGRKSVTA